jgi:hypothetical protein
MAVFPAIAQTQAKVLLGQLLVTVLLLRERLERR